MRIIVLANLVEGGGQPMSSSNTRHGLILAGSTPLDLASLTCNAEKRPSFCSTSYGWAAALAPTEGWPRFNAGHPWTNLDVEPAAESLRLAICSTHQLKWTLTMPMAKRRRAYIVQACAEYSFSFADKSPVLCSSGSVGTSDHQVDTHGRIKRRKLSDEVDCY